MRAIKMLHIKERVTHWWPGLRAEQLLWLEQQGRRPEQHIRLRHGNAGRQAVYSENQCNAEILRQELEVSQTRETISGSAEGSRKQTCRYQSGDNKPEDRVKRHEIRKLLPWQQTGGNNDRREWMSQHPDRTITLLSHNYDFTLMWFGAACSRRVFSPVSFWIHEYFPQQINMLNFTVLISF